MLITQARPKQAHVLLVDYWNGRNLGVGYIVPQSHGGLLCRKGGDAFASHGRRLRDRLVSLPLYDGQKKYVHEYVRRSGALATTL